MPLSYDERKPYGCKVCGTVPDEDGCIEHGKGCYTQSEDGGGWSFVELPKSIADEIVGGFTQLAEAMEKSDDLSGFRASRRSREVRE